MYNIDAFTVRDGFGKVEPLSVNREWIDDTWNGHAYHCFPVTLTNQLGWGISFPEDISFIWDGISDTDPSHVTVLEGEKYISTGRANATISFNTGIMFKTDSNATLLSMPVPNYFRDGISPFSTLISTSFYYGELPCAWRITRANEKITIKANTPIIALLPIDLSNLQDSSIVFGKPIPSLDVNMDEYSNAVYEMNREAKWANFYRNSTDHKGNSLGEHQVKKIKLNVINN